MSDADRSDYALGRLVLDYVRTFMWPGVVVLLLIFYEEDIRGIVSDREVDFFGLRIGAKVQAIEDRTKAEIEDLRALVAELRSRSTDSAAATDIATDISTKLTALENNLTDEVQTIRQTQHYTREPLPRLPSDEEALVAPANEKAAVAAKAERQGFEALIQRDYDGARSSFAKAYEAWPDYHNVAEILGLLKRDASRLQAGEETAWTALYRRVLTEYSWGIPKDLRGALRGETTKAY